MDLDEFQKEAGGIAKYQVGIIASILLIQLGPGWSGEASAILSAVPQHRCRLPTDDKNISVYNVSMLNYLVDGSCKRYDFNYSQCLNRSTISCLTNQTDAQSIPCDNGWVYSKEYYEGTTVSEWDFVCNRRVYDSIANSLYFFGFFVGSGVMGILCDWYGRRNAYLGSVLLCACAHAAAAISPWFPLYFLFRFLSGAGGIATSIGSFTLVNELVATPYRTKLNAVKFSFISWTATISTLIANFVRYWRDYYRIVSGVSFLVIPLFYFLPESPRWLILKGREKEAKTIINKIFESNGRKMNDNEWAKVVESERQKVEKEVTKAKLSYIDLFRRPMTRLVTLNVMFCWFVVSMVYYGLVLNVTKLAGDPYINAIINTAVTGIADISIILSEKTGRRQFLSLGFTVAGITCLLSMFLTLYAGSNTAMVTVGSVMAFLGKFFNAAAFSLIYVVTVESYPTSVRAIGLATGSTAARVGGMVTPFTLQLQYDVPWLTQTIFGTLSILAGATSLLFVETKNLNFTTTLKESEEFYKDKMKNTAKFFGSSEDNRDEKGTEENLL